MCIRDSVYTIFLCAAVLTVNKDDYNKSAQNESLLDLVLCRPSHDELRSTCHSLYHRSTYTVNRPQVISKTNVKTKRQMTWVTVRCRGWLRRLASNHETVICQILTRRRSTQLLYSTDRTPLTVNHMSNVCCSL